MKTYASLIFTFCFSLTAISQTIISTDFKAIDSKRDIVPTGTIFASKALDSQWGMSFFALITDEWGEVLVGPTYSTKDQVLSIGLQFGMETADANWRTGASAVYYKNNHLAMLFLEKGPGSENYWYSIQYKYQKNKILYGFRGQRFYGWGGELGFRITKSQSVSLAPLYDFEAKEMRPTIFWSWTL